MSRFADMSEDEFHDYVQDRRDERACEDAEDRKLDERFMAERRAAAVRDEIAVSNARQSEFYRQWTDRGLDPFEPARD